MAQRLTDEGFLDALKSRLEAHGAGKISDPQSNPVKRLAYDISKDVEDRQVAFRHIESLVKRLSDEAAIARAARLRTRAGVNRLAKLRTQVEEIAEHQAASGWDEFKAWAEHPAFGIVLTAHPTFSLSRDIRNVLGDMVGKTKATDAQKEQLASYPYLPKRAPTLIEEHQDTQAALGRIQDALDIINAIVLKCARANFPDQWAGLIPHLSDAYSWVGYDIDGRTDISWGDALRLRLSEKRDQIASYLARTRELRDQGAPLAKLETRLSDALGSASRDLELFETDITLPENLVAAANNLTRQSPRRLLDVRDVFPLLDEALSTSSDELAIDISVLKARMSAFGLGTARIHFRLNARHLTAATKPIFGQSESRSDNRTVLRQATKLTQSVKAQPVNFASLALESSTAHEKMILTAQIHKYIDSATPIRLLIAETEDSLVPLGALYLARLYGLENHLDISPLFETADALNNGGRIIGKMLSNPAYKAYIKARGVFAIQTGFSDAGRFMGQVPATLAIERLHSHFAAKMAEHDMGDVTALVFNTHGEGLGRGGHPGTITERVNYAMSPWAIHQFDRRGIKLTHEVSFQGGDGFLWFQTPKLAEATALSLTSARFADRSTAAEDPFYLENDFSWDIFRTIGSSQEQLYADPDYVQILGGFGQNLLIPTGSRAAKRAKGGAGTDAFDPRQLRAIPHNAILQQFGIPANIIYGVGRAAAIDPEKFENLLERSHRAQSIFKLVQTSMQRTNLSILTGYGRLFDPGFWISRALSGEEPRLADRSLVVAETLTNLDWRSQIMDLSNRLRFDLYDSQRFLSTETGQNDTLVILHALRLAVIMKMMIIMTELPVIGDSTTSRLSVLQKMQSFQIDDILEDLATRYPAATQSLEWTKDLTESTDATLSAPGGFPHIAETITKPLTRARDLVRQITVAITHHYDAFG